MHEGSARARGSKRVGRSGGPLGPALVRPLVAGTISRRALLAFAGLGAVAALAGCAASPESGARAGSGSAAPASSGIGSAEAEDAATQAATDAEAARAAARTRADELRSALPLTEDYRDELVHGEKPAEFQKYIVLHDTEGNGSAAGVVDYWVHAGRFIAAHFIIGKDGGLVQCVPVDKIAHHAGFGDTGHNAEYGVTDESRDDKRGAKPLGAAHADYGMNSYSIGIEMVHVGGSGDYPAAQLATLDQLIAYLDAWCEAAGVPVSTIIDHKMWRTGNSDTSPEFAGYLASYRDHRSHA